MGADVPFTCTLTFMMDTLKFGAKVPDARRAFADENRITATLKD